MNVNGQSSRVHAYMNNHCAQLNNGVRATKQWGARRFTSEHDCITIIFNFLIFMLSVSDLEFPILYKT